MEKGISHQCSGRKCDEINQNYFELMGIDSQSKDPNQGNDTHDEDCDDSIEKVHGREEEKER